ncbi:MAG: TonB-dependent receptor plug domain-containing protein [Candidatus Latescibacteria bacterium]|nr:TonB-dependent receptor plug domain-containing protein [Candidatus Latescibacterota bacterium]
MQNRPLGKRPMLSILALVWGLATLPVAAQQPLPQGSILGRVVDKASKQPLANVNIHILLTDLGTITDAQGRFDFAGLEENVYKLRLSHIGYQAHIETDVRVVRNKSTFIEDIELAQALVAVAGTDVVAGGGPYEEDVQAPVSAVNYTREEIKRMPGASGDIFRALEAMPGVSTSGGEFAAFSVRGGSPRENVVMIDNIPFDKLTHFNGGSEEQEKQGGRFSIFAPGLIEEAHFQAGGFSPAYGGKFSSLLDLKVKEGNRHTPTLDGRYDLLGWEINYDGPSYIHDHTSLLISARRQDFTRVLELTGRREFGSPRFTDLIVKTSSQWGAAHKLTLLALYTPENFDRNARDVFESDGFAQTDLTDLDESKSLLGLNWRILTGRTSFLQSTLYWRNTDRQVAVGRGWPLFNDGQAPTSAAAIGVKDILGEDRRETELGWRQVFTYLPAERASLTAGLQVSRTRFDLARVQSGLDTTYVFDQNDYRPDLEQKFIVTSPEFVDADYDQAKTLLAAFSQNSYTYGDRTTVNLGLRYEYSQFNRQHYWAPRGSFSFRPDAKTRLSLAAGLYYQTPEFSVLTADPANGRLRNEQAQHYIAGLTRYLRQDLKLSVEAYYKRFDDLVVRQDRTTQRRLNAGDGDAAGVDISLVRRFVDDYFGQVNYSFSRSQRNDQAGAGSYNSDFNQPHIFSLLGGYQFNKEWSVSAKWRYATGRPADRFVIHGDIFADLNRVRFSKEITLDNGTRLPAFHTFNIRLDYRRQLGRLALVSFLDIVNLYDHLNVNEERFQEIDGGQDQRGFGILPTGGVKIEF